jgi:hypothetical protein
MVGETTVAAGTVLMKLHAANRTTAAVIAVENRLV